MSIPLGVNNTGKKPTILNGSSRCLLKIQSTARSQLIFGEENKENTDSSISSVHAKPRKKAVIFYESNPEKDVIYDPFNTCLPAEIQHFILQKLAFKDLLNLRLLSAQWKESVESFKKFNIVINEERDYDGKLSITRMGRCEIVTLMSAKNRRLFEADTPDSVKITKRISQWNVGDLMNKWFNLTKLTISWKPLINSYMFRYCVKYEPNPNEPRRERMGFLPFLETLKISILPSAEGDVDEVLNQNLIYLLRWHYPCLRHLLVDFVTNSVKQEIIGKVSSFVNRHSNTLRKIDIRYSTLTRRVLRTVPQRSLLFDNELWDWRRRTSFSKARAINLSDYRLEYPYETESAEIEDESRKWQQLLRNERYLEYLIASKLQINIRRVEFFHFYIKLFAEQLTVIELINLSVYDIDKEERMSPIDMKSFNECKNLKKLGMWRAPILLNESLPEAASEIINFAGLPDTISHLTIDGLPIESKDLLLGIQKYKNLTKFNYTRAAMPRRNHLPQSGITFSVLQALLSHSTLLSMEVMTASSVPQKLILDDCGFPKLVTHNEWKIKEVKLLWHNCVIVSLFRGHLLPKTAVP